jgi:hypothetical protein
MTASSFPTLLTYPLAASLGLSVLPWGKYVLYPFRLFTTWVHECCHAFMALLLGGSVTRITLAPDTSGLTSYRLPAGRLRLAIVTSAGYLGSSVVGCGIYALSLSAHRHAPHLLLGLGGLMVLSLLVWVRGWFGLLIVSALASGFIALGYQGEHRYAEMMLVFLALQTGLNAIFDIRTLFSLDARSKSDAHAMQSLYWLPSWFWAVLWMGLSIALTYWTIKRA